MDGSEYHNNIQFGHGWLSDDKKHIQFGHGWPSDSREHIHPGVDRWRDVILSAEIKIHQLHAEGMRVYHNTGIQMGMLSFNQKGRVRNIPTGSWECLLVHTQWLIVTAPADTSLHPIPSPCNGGHMGHTQPGQHKNGCKAHLYSTETTCKKWGRLNDLPECLVIWTLGKEFTPITWTSDTEFKTPTLYTYTHRPGNSTRPRQRKVILHWEVEIHLCGVKVMLHATELQP